MKEISHDKRCPTAIFNCRHRLNYSPNTHQKLGTEYRS